MISQSATATDLTQEDQVDVFHRVVGYDDFQGAAIAKYLTEARRHQGVRGRRLRRRTASRWPTSVEETLGDLVVDSDKTQVGQTDFAPTVSKIESAAPDAVFYGGYIAEAGAAAQADARRRHRRPRSSVVTASTAPTSRTRPGEAGEGAIITCPCVPADEDEHLRRRLRGGVRQRSRRLRRRGLRRGEHLPRRPSTTGSHPRGHVERSSTATPARASPRSSSSTRTVTSRRRTCPTGPTRSRVARSCRRSRSLR